MAQILTYLDAPIWRAVRQLYLKDKVIEALQEAENLGGQDSNDLYAEAEVREKGTRWELTPWLALEGIESELGHYLGGVKELAMLECDSLSKRFGWDNREKTLIALLPQDVEAPWMPGRWGYFVDKEPYDKICLPHHLVAHPDALRATIRHEFMHQITLNLSQGRATRWLSEGLSTYAEERFDQGAWHAFRTGAASWLKPEEVEALVATDNRKSELQHSISLAYNQANFVIRYLSVSHGEQILGEILSAMSHESLVQTFQAELLFRSHVDSALRKLLHFSELELFDRALAWLKGA